VELTRQLHPDFVLMDVNMPVMDGIEAVRLIKSDMPGTRIVMLTVAEDEETLFQAIRNGASGYLLKGLQADEFFHLLEELSRGETPISPHLSTLMLKEFSQNVQSGSDLPEQNSADLALTERQLEILTLSAQRMTYKEIASRLYLSEATVKYHVTQILDRLHVKTRVEAIQKAEKEGLFHPDA
jgi:two-component system NarL family response regulator